MTARMITREELQDEALDRTVRCSACSGFIRYRPSDRVTDLDRRRRFVRCPGCGHERVLAISSDGSL